MKDKEINNKNMFEDLIKVQTELPSIEYNESVSFGKVNFKYASLPSIHKIVKPILNSNNFILSYMVNEGSIDCLLLHSSGNIHGNSIEFKPLSDAKQTGALITYYKRYLLSALLALDTEDDKDIQPLDNVNGSAKKVKLTKEAYKKAQERIANKEQGVLTKCVAYFDMTEDQHQTLLNLELEHNG